MKVVVIGLGVLIFVALGLIAWRLVVLASEGEAGRSLPQTRTPLQPAIQLAIPTGARVEALSLDGRRLAVSYSAGTAQAIAVVDLTNGRVLSRVKITAGAGKP